MTRTYTKRSLLIKGRIGAAAAALALVSYVIYYAFYYEGIKLDELYFISTGISISVFTGILFTLSDSKGIKTLLIFTSVFYGILISIYSLHWMITGLPYAYIKISLILGLIVGLIYYFYDTIRYARNDSKNRPNGDS